MEMDKVLNLDHEEIAQHLRQSSEQVFRLRFQLKMGQMEGLKKLRELRKDIARMKTVERQRELGIALPAHATENKPEHHARKTAKSKPAKTARSSKATRKTTKAKTSKKSTRTRGKVKATGQTRTKTAKRGRANAKKGS